MSLTDTANELFIELGEPSDMSMTSISYWLESNIGGLNSSLRKSYSVQSNLTTSPSMGLAEKYIFKKMFLVYYYGYLARKTLGAASTSSVLQVTQAGKTVRLVNKNEISKVYTQLKKDEQAILDDCIKLYKRGQFSPKQVTGDDTAAVRISTTTTSDDYNRY